MIEGVQNFNLTEIYNIGDLDISSHGIIYSSRIDSRQHCLLLSQLGLRSFRKVWYGLTNQRRAKENDLYRSIHQVDIDVANSNNAESVNAIPGAMRHRMQRLIILTTVYFSQFDDVPSLFLVTCRSCHHPCPHSFLVQKCQQCLLHPRFPRPQ